MVGYIDPTPNTRLERLHLEWWGDDETAAGRLRAGLLLLTVGGVEGVATRRSLADRYSAAGCAWQPQASRAVLADDVDVGEGVTILARAALNPARGSANTASLTQARSLNTMSRLEGTCRSVLEP